MHASENIFSSYSVQLLSVSDPHQELCHWTQASMQTPILGWRNLSLLLCFLCTPVQTVINPTSHRSYRSLENIKHQSLSSNSLTLYIGLTVQCALRAENLYKKTDNATSSSGLGVLSICTMVGLRALSFKRPLLSLSVEFCMCVREFEVKYLGNQRS